VSDKTNIVLGSGDAAIIIREDGARELLLPGRKPTDPVTESGWVITLLSFALDDEEIMRRLKFKAAAEIEGLRKGRLQ
jgi:hypothetical protein